MKVTRRSNYILFAGASALALSTAAPAALAQATDNEDTRTLGTVLVTTQLGVQPKQFSPKHLKDLLDIKQTLGVPDPRIGLKECELCDNDEWRPGVTCAVPAKGGDNGTKTDPEAETVVKAVTDEILNRLKG